MLPNGSARFSLAWWESKTTYDIVTGCLLWNGFADPGGYCRVSKDGKGGLLVHRVAYECFYGPFDPALKVCHSCDNPTCLHPHHLFLGTQKDNLRDMFAKGRARPQGRVPGEQREQVLALHASNPRLTQTEIARQISTSKQRVGQILRDAGIRLGKRRKATVAAAVSSHAVASEISHGGVTTPHEIHLRRTEDSPKDAVAPWQTVLGLPPVVPTQAIQVWKRPLEWTGNPRQDLVSSAWCADAAPLGFASPACLPPEQRQA